MPANLDETRQETQTKWVYAFGGGDSEGSAAQKNLLGGKGANLAEMSRLGLPVPPGFTLTTEVCSAYYKLNKAYPPELKAQVEAALAALEAKTGKVFGDGDNPLLVSVRSGARASMPGMMDTVLNLGLSTVSVEGLARKAGARFAYDSYRRFIQMYANVVLNIGHDSFEHILDDYKKSQAYELDTAMQSEDWQVIIGQYKNLVLKKLGRPFPEDPREQLWGAIGAVFSSWMNDRAILYRKLNDIPEAWGTAVNVQSMVFGNMGETSATGVAFTRNPSTGEKVFYGEFLTNAQGEDVVAGIRTPVPISVAHAEALKRASSQNPPAAHHNMARDNSKKIGSRPRTAYETKAGDSAIGAARVDKDKSEQDQTPMETLMPEVFAQLVEVAQKLEHHYRDMQDIEFTVEAGKLYMLQTRNGKRTAAAALKVAMDMVREGVLSQTEAVLRLDPSQLDQLLHPMIAPEAKRDLIVSGLPASPGAAVGEVVFTSQEAVKRAADGKDVILVRVETSPEDIRGMHVAKAIVTARGGMTSHAAVVARGWGLPCVCGAGGLQIDVQAGVFRVAGRVIAKGEVITVDGAAGQVLYGAMPMVDPDLSGDFGLLMSWADDVRQIKVRANAETPADVRKAKEFGAEGIGLCRTEHMFFDAERIPVVRAMILAKDIRGREAALARLLPMQRSDFVEIFSIMGELPCTIRLLDPPLHEFLPHNEAEMQDVAASSGVSLAALKAQAEALYESNPMLGHRGCRLGITYPEIYAMQARAIFEAAVDVAKTKGFRPIPEVMIPLIATTKEFDILKALIDTVAGEVFAVQGLRLDYLVGTMIELPRAALRAGDIARGAEFFSFGTNDLTQTTLGISRDDAGRFLKNYEERGIYEKDPFVTLDQEGVGELLQIAKTRGRQTRPELKLGLCGEHGGDSASVQFCHKIGLDYVSCSPYRVPIARLAAAHAALKANLS